MKEKENEKKKLKEKGKAKENNPKKLMKKFLRATLLTMTSNAPILDILIIRTLFCMLFQLYRCSTSCKNKRSGGNS